MPWYIRRRPGFTRDVSGAGLAEYALIAALVAGVSSLAVVSLGNQSRSVFSDIAGGGAGGGGTGVGPGSGGAGWDGPGSGGVDSGDAGTGDSEPMAPQPGVPGENFAITLGGASLPQATQFSPWTFDFSTLVALQDPGTVTLSDLSWSSGSLELPSWISLDAATGIGSGSPITSGEVSFEIVASYLDHEGRQVFTLEVGGVTIDVVQIGAGSAHTCVVTTAGAALCWGYNLYGRLGDGTAVSSSVPVAVQGLESGVASIAVGDAHTCAVTTSGTAMCWGWGAWGQLGNGTKSSSETPVAVSGLSGVTAAITAGSSFTCAVTTSGAAMCWGRNTNGELGNGTITERTTPVIVSGLATGVVSISAGPAHACAVTTSGAARCWGNNADGQIGDGTTTDRLTPMAVWNLNSGVASIAAGANHTCAVTTSGAARCWGRNLHGQIGDGTTTNRLTQRAVSNLGSGVVSIAAGGNHTCAVTTTGAALCWGLNNRGQLGDGTSTQRLTPVTGSNLGLGVAAITTGQEHTCAVTTSGAALCWGRNGSGRLGDGTTTQRHTPVDVVF